MITNKTNLREPWFMVPKGNFHMEKQGLVPKQKCSVRTMKKPLQKGENGIFSNSKVHNYKDSTKFLELETFAD